MIEIVSRGCNCKVDDYRLVIWMVVLEGVSCGSEFDDTVSTTIKW